ncbi:hypothetical protein ACKGJO_07765 [Gracilimonas sp. Q87]|uniref:hypothetical protein n=1 Tax=Gracilimonas sp. Q87 TaxID=3384766 RepID=UPI003983F0CA
MKRFKNISKLLLVAALLFTGCEGQESSLIEDRLNDNPLPSDPNVNYTAGDADFSNYISIGNSLTAGYMDGALYDAGQQNSLPALIASQLAVVGNESFNQPNINSINGFNTTVENPQNGFILGRYKLDTSIPGPSPVVGGDPISNYTGATSELNNFGVPGIVVGQLLTPATGGPNSEQNPAFNPFYQRFASNPSQDGQTGSTIINDAISAQPTFFSLWIGNNDVLGYAAGGASNENILTDDGDFQAQFNGVINSLMGNTQADGVVANIPPLLGLAYFQAVPYDAIPLESQQQAEALNNGYQDYNNGLLQAEGAGLIDEDERQRRTIEFEVGANPFVMEDETLTDLSALGLPNYRQSESTDLVILSAATAFATGVGTQSAAGDELVLIPQEQQQIEVKRATFNSMIANAVSNYPDRLALYDTNAPSGVFADIFGLSDGTPGIIINGVNLQPDFSPNGILSTDAVHPNQRGNAILANEFLKVIEENFNATLPEVDVLNLPSVQICAGDCASQIGS